MDELHGLHKVSEILELILPELFTTKTLQQ